MRSRAPALRSVAVAAAGLLCVVGCGIGQEGGPGMNSDELRALASDMMTASLSVLGPENRSAPFGIDRDCRDAGGKPSGRVYVGRAYNSNLP